MATPNNSLVQACIDNGHGRCATHSHDRIHDGQCKIGRCQMGQTETCPCCSQQFPKDRGFVIDPKAIGTMNVNSIEQYTIMTDNGQPVCAACAKEHNTDSLTIFVNRDALRQQVEKFVKDFLSGQPVWHRHERIGGVEHNWCDQCNQPVSLEDEDRMGGVIRGNSVICLCPACDDLAHQAIPDLPKTTFFQGMADVGCPIRRPQSRFGDEKAAVPIHTVRRHVSRPSLVTVEDVFGAINDGWRLTYGQRVGDGHTECVVHANVVGLCYGADGGVSDWNTMGGIVHDGRAYGFCPACTKELALVGIILPRTFKQVFLGDVLGVEIRSDRQVSVSRTFDRQPVRVEMEFVNPNKKASSPKSRSGRETPRDHIKAAADLALNAKLAEIDKKIVAKRAEFEGFEVRIASQKVDLAAAANETDLELRVFFANEAENNIAQLRAEQAEVVAEIDCLTHERERFVAGGWKLFRSVPKSASQPAESKPKKEKGKKGKSQAA